MLLSYTLLAVNSSWSTQKLAIMLICNIIAIIIGRYGIQVRGVGPAFPLSNISGFGLTELLATTSLGHIIGAGAILGLQNINLI